MGLADRISIIAAVVNGLVLVVMAGTLVLQARALRHSKEDIQLALLGVRSHSLATLIGYLDNRVSRIDSTQGLEAQKEKTELETELSARIADLNDVMNAIHSTNKEGSS